LSLEEILVLKLIFLFFVIVTNMVYV
jgi:hypothetical protein